MPFVASWSWLGAQPGMPTGEAPGGYDVPIDGTMHRGAAERFPGRHAHPSGVCSSGINSRPVLRTLPTLLPDLGRRQRAAPVVVSEGPAAGGGVWFSAVDPGVPLGPGLLGMCVMFHGPHVRIATARMSAAAIRANRRRLP
jgi:hypothetical protein